jgi:hypothetical protein
MISFVESLFALSGIVYASEDASRVLYSGIVGQRRDSSALAIVFASGAVVIVERCGATSISGIVFVHSIVIIEISSQSAVTTATCIVAIVRGVAARTSFEVVSVLFGQFLGCLLDHTSSGLPAVLLCCNRRLTSLVDSF